MCDGLLHRWMRCRSDKGPSRWPTRSPIVLVPGLLTSARLYGEQLPALWQLGPVTVADHTRDDTMAAIAGRILAAAPPRSPTSSSRS
jgi:hypothetical protein